MDFELTKEQLELKEIARKYVEEEVIPKIAEYDRKEEFPQEIVQKAFDLGIMNVRLPKEYGGRGLGLLEEVIIIEEIAVGCTGLATSINVNSLGFEPIILAGNKEFNVKQKKKVINILSMVLNSGLQMHMFPIILLCFARLGKIDGKRIIYRHLL
ncbi:MAG: acyl-CoA dehydrogenase family protein [Candidatus Helarchaeota archaeon]